MHEENYRIRKCVVYFYLEDGSIHVAEPKQPNSGIPQGVFLKRHRVPKEDGTAFAVEDLNVGQNVTLYSRVFHLYSCDPFTRNFLEKSGVDVPQEEYVPDEPITVYRDSLKKVKHGRPKPQNDDLTRFMEARLGKASSALCADKLKKFVENDRKVLRFFCVWDDRASLCGERRPYVLHFFLSDDTAEILEVNEPNSGRDPFPKFVKRAPLSNTRVESDALGPTKSYTHYTAKDLMVGRTITVYNREFFIHDCDDFTRQYYIEQLGVSEEELSPIDITEHPDPIPQMELPPYNGFGSQLDTIQNCVSLIPKPAKKDFHKMMNNEKKVLRFMAKLNSDEKHTLPHADVDRKFVISFFLADDTVRARAERAVGRGGGCEKRACVVTVRVRLLKRPFLPPRLPPSPPDVDLRAADPQLGHHRGQVPGALGGVETNGRAALRRVGPLCRIKVRSRVHGGGSFCPPGGTTHCCATQRAAG